MEWNVTKMESWGEQEVKRNLKGAKCEAIALREQATVEKVKYSAVFKQTPHALGNLDLWIENVCVAKILWTSFYQALMCKGTFSWKHWTNYSMCKACDELLAAKTRVSAERELNCFHLVSWIKTCNTIQYRLSGVKKQIILMSKFALIHLFCTSQKALQTKSWQELKKWSSTWFLTAGDKWHIQTA